MSTIDRRLAKLEQEAPTGIYRPDGLTGEAFVSYVISEICNAEGRTEREQSRVRGALLDLMTPEEIRICEERVRVSIDAIQVARPQPTSGRRTA
ncbi:MAG: hypothetical protein JNL87_01125 [Burkholderiaceae bacterium]|nr:hypothetical protein [Burkholderiaceae bacterium]